MGILKLFLLPELDVRQMIEEKNKNKVSAKTLTKALFHNKYIFIFEIALLLKMIVQGMSMGTYYFKYIVGDISLLSIISLVGILSMVLMPFIPALTRKLSIRHFVSFFLIVGGLSNLLIYIAPANMFLLAFAAFMNVLAALPISMLMNIIAIDCMKYSEWKDGVQVEGLISAMNGVSQKVGLAVGAVIVGLLLSVGGYSGSLAEQPGSALSMIQFLYIG